jgi:NADH-quinone oxidoreductase subunit N
MWRHFIVIILLGLFGLSALAMLADSFFPKSRVIYPVLGLGLLALFLLTFFPGTDVALLSSNMVSFDIYSTLWTRLILGISFIFYLIYPSSKKDIHYSHIALLFFSLMGAVLLTSFSHMLLLFLGIEMLSIPLYLLVGTSEKSISLEASLKYFLMGSFASAVLLFGIALVFVTTGQFDLSQILLFVHTFGCPLLLQAGVLLILVGFLFKVGVIPFHFWIPDAYEGAPLPYTIFMSTVVKIAAFSGFYRFLNLGALVSSRLDIIFGLTAGISIFFGTIFALQQRSVQRMMAYSGIAHAGFMVIALFVGSASTLFYYSIGYGIGSLCVFYGMALSRLGAESDSDDIVTLLGLSSRNHTAALLMCVGLLSLAGIPPLAGFFGKYSVILQAFSIGNWGLVIMAILGSLLGLYLYSRVISVLFISDPQKLSLQHVSFYHKCVAGIVVCLVVILGIFPNILL